MASEVPLNPRSRYSVVFACVCRIDAGAIGETGPSTHAFTAFAFRASGTTAMISLDFRICRTDIEIARAGTSSIDANQPSPTCCRRHASSSVTMMYGCSVEKSAGGSLKARWPFSPMPTNARSTGRCRERVAGLSRNLLGICFAFEQVIPADANFVDEPIEQVAPKAGGMVDRQADVLVEMKHLDARPVDAVESM